MGNFIKKYEIWIFLILAPIINTLFVYVTDDESIPNFVYTHGRFYLLLGFLILIVKYTKGFEGVKELFRPMLNWKVNPKWYLFSFLFALSVATLTLLIKSFFLGTELSLTLKFPSLWRTISLLTWAFVGEVVWVSYSVRELSKSTKPFYASQIVGLFWAIWWIPVVFLGIGVIPDLPIWPLLLHMMGAAGMCAVVYGKTKSGICVLILQFMLNFTGILLPVSPVTGGVQTYILFAILYFLTMLVFMYFMNPNEAFKTKEKS